jgi:hypothetical protein
MDVLKKVGNALRKFWHRVVYDLSSYRQHRKMSEDYLAGLDELKKRMNVFSEGTPFAQMGELTGGKWINKAYGVRSRLITCPMNLLPIMRRLTILEIASDEDSKGTEIHRHDVDGSDTNQVIFVENGKVAVAYYDSDGKKLITTAVYHKGDMAAIPPHTYHTLSMSKGSRLICVFFPPI